LTHHIFVSGRTASYDSYFLDQGNTSLMALLN
jgi:hypothetical protein